MVMVVWYSVGLVLNLGIELRILRVDPTTMFNLQHVFDGKVAGIDPYIFASEYAVTGGGGNGNLIVRLPSPETLDPLQTLTTCGCHISDDAQAMLALH